MERFDEFLTERKYLKNVTDKTLVYYKSAFKSWERHSQGDWKIWIINLSNRGVSAVSINTYICAMNAYWKWAGAGLKVAYLQEEQKILATFSAQQVSRIVHRKPVGRNETRIHAMAVTALDNGLRLQELLNLTRQDVDFDNLVLHVKGKGNRHRLVPMSIELRKMLYRYLANHHASRLFCTERGTSLTPRNADRDFKVMCRKIGLAGVRCSFHTLRHSFAVNYLRAGGNLYYLQRILGHSSITTTERYLRSLGIEDLQKVHDGLSLLSR